MWSIDMISAHALDVYTAVIAYGLGYAHHQTNATALELEFGRVSWGTPGRYLPRKMLRTFVDTSGHEYETLLDGTMEDEVDVDVDSEILPAVALVS